MQAVCAAPRPPLFLSLTCPHPYGGVSVISYNTGLISPIPRPSLPQAQSAFFPGLLRACCQIK